MYQSPRDPSRTESVTSDVSLVAEPVKSSKEVADMGKMSSKDVADMGKMSSRDNQARLKDSVKKQSSKQKQEQVGSLKRGRKRKATESPSAASKDQVFTEVKINKPKKLKF